MQILPLTAKPPAPSAAFVIDGIKVAALYVMPYPFFLYGLFTHIFRCHVRSSLLVTTIFDGFISLLFKSRNQDKSPGSHTELGVMS